MGDNLPMVLCKDLKEGDRQTTGIGEADDHCPTISTCHHRAIAEIVCKMKKDDMLSKTIVEAVDDHDEKNETGLMNSSLSIGGNLSSNQCELPYFIASIDGDKMGKKERAGGSGLGINTDTNVSYTLTVKDVHAIAYCAGFMGGQGKKARSIGYQEEVSPTIKSALSGGNTVPDIVYVEDANPGDSVSYGINPQASLMYPLSKEVSKVITVGHQSGIVVNNLDLGNCNMKENMTIEMKEPQEKYLCSESNSVSYRVKSVIRRLLPVECERLMGFPDNHTKITWRNKTVDECPDAPRYKACGNSMCVNCMEWLGRRIQMSEDGNSSRSEIDSLAETTCWKISFCDSGGTSKYRPCGGLYVFETDVSNTLSTACGNNELLIFFKKKHRFI